MLPAREIPARPVNINSFQIDRRNCQSHYVFRKNTQRSTEANYAGTISSPFLYSGKIRRTGPDDTSAF